MMREPIPIDPDPDDVQESSRGFFGALGIVMALVVIATLAVLAFAILGRSGEEPAARGGGLLTTPPPNEAPAGPGLLRAVELRSTPSPDSPVVALLGVQTEIRVLGRSSDGGWLVIGPANRPEVAGWVPAHLVRGVQDLMGLDVIRESAQPAPPPAPTLTPDLPELRIVRAFSRQNQLWVEVANEGAGEAVTVISVAVDDGDPVIVDPKPGEPLRPSESFEAPIPQEYVQLRSQVRISLFTDPPIEEETREGHNWSGIVAPDEPNDLEIRWMDIAQPEGYVRVTVRNNSPIPVRGNIVLTVREALPSTTLLGRQTIFVELPRGGTLDLEFHELMRDDIDGLTAHLSTDAIEDASIENNTYPR